MIEDIESARKYVYIETFRVAKDVIGERFKRALTRKAKEGVEVKENENLALKVIEYLLKEATWEN